MKIVATTSLPAVDRRTPTAGMPHARANIADILTYKVIKSGLPVYLGRKLTASFPYRTRQATTGAVRYGEEFSSRRAINHRSYKYRAATEYNRLPGEIREAKTVGTFKTKLRQWITENIPLT